MIVRDWLGTVTSKYLKGIFISHSIFKLLALTNEMLGNEHQIPMELIILSQLVL